MDPIVSKMIRQDTLKLAGKMISASSPTKGDSIETSIIDTEEKADGMDQIAEFKLTGQKSKSSLIQSPTFRSKDIKIKEDN